MMLSLSKFYSARALRVSKMVGSNLKETFAVKSLIKKHPFLMTFLVTALFTIILSYALKIVEGPVFKLKIISNPTYSNDFTNTYNCIWYVMVTMTTVGYGDYVTSTNLGRLLSLINAVMGNLILSLLILSLQQQFFFIKNEEKSYVEITNEIALSSIESESATLFQLSLRYFKAKKKYISLLRLQDKIKTDEFISILSNAFEEKNLEILNEFSEEIKKIKNLSMYSNDEKANVLIELKNRKLDKLISDSKEKLKEVLYQKILKEKKIGIDLKDYRNSFGYLTEDMVLSEQVKELLLFRDNVDEKLISMDSHLKQIRTTLDFIEKVSNEKTKIEKKINDDKKDKKYHRKKNLYVSSKRFLNKKKTKSVNSSYSNFIDHNIPTKIIKTNES